MSLRMYGYSIEKDSAPKGLFFPNSDLDKIYFHDFWEESKIKWLHNWFKDQHYKSGGEGPFNNVCLYVTEYMLDDLKFDISNGALEQYDDEEPFFSDNRSYKDCLPLIMEFISLAKEEISDGQLVVYDSWW